MLFNRYSDLIRYVKLQPRIKGGKEYYEAHHIIPRNMGGPDTQDNIVLLTIEEHVLAHYLLALENEGINDRAYVANIQSASFIISGKSKFSHKKREEIEKWLQDPESQKLATEIKTRFVEAKRNTPGANKGKSIKDGTMKSHFEHIWVRKATQKPVRILSKNLGIGSWVGYEQIPDCPICHNPNSEESFACCTDHEIEYLRDTKSRLKEYMSKKTKETWQNADVAAKRKAGLVGKTTNQGYLWITKGDSDLMIAPEDLDKYLSDGWSKGRIHGIGHAQSEEARKNISEAKKDMCYISNDTVAAKAVPLSELDTYLANGWTRGRRDGTSRKGIKQPPMAWVNKDGEFKKIRQADLEKYYAEGWKRGRTS